MTLDTIMTPSPASVSMDDTLLAVRELFNRRHFHHAIVTDDEPPSPHAPMGSHHGRGRVVGVISDRDLLRNISPFIGKLSERPQDAASANRKVHQVMTRRLVWAAAHTPIQEGAAIMIRHDISCLPILDEAGRCIGIVTARDVMRWLAEKATCRPRDDDAADTQRQAA